MKYRLDQLLVIKKLADSRSQAANLIRLGQVMVDNKPSSKPGILVDDSRELAVTSSQRFVSRAGLKLASVANKLSVRFSDRLVLDVGSSTGGFTDYALQHAAKKVYAIDVGTDQLHQSLRPSPRIELHEKTDIRDVFSNLTQAKQGAVVIDTPDIVVIDVSFISLRDILPHIAKDIAGSKTEVIAMVKPQFEAGKQQVNKGVIKNDSLRRQILKDFETWSRQYFTIKDKADSDVAGAKGNRERFYKLAIKK